MKIMIIVNTTTITITTTTHKTNEWNGMDDQTSIYRNYILRMKLYIQFYNNFVVILVSL